MQCQAQRGILEFTYQGPRARPLHVPRAPVGVHRARLDRHVRRRGGTGMNEAAPTAVAGATRPRQRRRALALLWIVAAARRARPRDLVADRGRSAEQLRQRRAAGREPDLRAHGPATPAASDVLVRAGGSEPMTIAQVQVDDAYWQFTQDPPGPLARGAHRLAPRAVPLGARRGACRQHRHQHRRHLRARDRGRGRHADARQREPDRAGAARRLRRHRCRSRSA